MAFSFGTMISVRTARTLLSAALALGLGCAPMLAGCNREQPAGVIQKRAEAETRPNILVVLVDHLGPELTAYGQAVAATPDIDRLAREGTVFLNAYAASGGEDAATAALLTGDHPSTIGVVQEWTGEPRWTADPPPEVRGFPELLRARGWHTFRIGTRPDPFGSPASLWVENVTAPDAAWAEGAIPQPFLGVVELSTLPREEDAKPAKTQSSKKDKAAEKTAGPAPIDAATLRVPGYLPDTPAVRAALKAEYERIERVDTQVGAVLARLEKAGVLDHTIVVFTAKSGPARPRAERTVYDSGARVPLIVRFPGAKPAVRRDLVSGVDLAPSILKLVGVQPLAWMQGKDRFGRGAEAARQVFTVQNRVDGAYERAFAVRDGRWLYVVNLAFDTPIAALARKGELASAVDAAHKAGGLNPAQARLYTAERPDDELYDLKADPFQLVNLADDPARVGEVTKLAQALNTFAQAAPDYSTWSARDLGDLFKPGGSTPAAATPTGAVGAGVLTLESVTPGASILWRADKDQPWRLYAGPVKVPADGEIEAKASRYGFQESPIAAFGGKQKKK